MSFIVFNSILFLFSMKWLFHCAGEHFIVIGALQGFIVLYYIVLYCIVLHCIHGTEIVF